MINQQNELKKDESQTRIIELMSADEDLTVNMLEALLIEGNEFQTSMNTIQTLIKDIEQASRNEMDDLEEERIRVLS